VGRIIQIDKENRMSFVLLETVEVDQSLNDYIDEVTRPAYDNRTGQKKLKKMVDRFVVIHAPEGKIQLNIADLYQGPCITCCSNVTNLPDDATKYEVFQAVSCPADTPTGGEHFHLVDTIDGEGKTFDEFVDWAGCSDKIGDYDRNDHFGVVYLPRGKRIAMNVESLAHGNRCGCIAWCSDEAIVQKVEIWKLT
jgi:hypothetical protein